METKPVRKYAQPKYPTRLEITARPALLHRHQPPAWRKWPELTGAAGLFLLADAARLPAADTPQKGGQTPAQAKAIAVVAPIFQHGEGRGATGCIVMSPPVFLSEEEALQVIKEEMTTKGIKLGTNRTELAGVSIDRFVWLSNQPGAANPAKSPKYEIRTETVKADASDPQKKVLVEFVGQRDERTWAWERQKEEGNLVVSSVQSYDFPSTAAYFAERVKRDATDKVYVGTFYDPLAKKLEAGELLSGMMAEKAQSANAKPQGAYAQAKAESRYLLRLQVQDFLKWLQAQGAI